MKNTAKLIRRVLAAHAVTMLVLPTIGFAENISSQASAAAPAPDNMFTANVALYDQYIFRGLTQTNRKPALQGGFDYAHKSGFYAGFWGSNISWISDVTPAASASLETDFYGGYKGSFAGDWSYDVGYLRYQYFGTYPSGFVKPNTDELYGQLGWKWVTLKLSDSISNKTFGVDNSKNAYYLDLTTAIPLNEQFTLTLHAGKQKYKGANNGTSNDSLYTYNDYKAELAGTFGTGWSAGAGITDTNAKDAGYLVASTGRNIGNNQSYVFIKRTF